GTEGPSSMRLALACFAAAAFACSRGDPLPPGQPATGLPDGGRQPEQPDGGWVTESEEDFQSADLGAPEWQPDPVPDDGPFADQGAFFRKQRVVQPQGWRISSPFGRSGWLTRESYTRTRAAPLPSRAANVGA